MRKFLISLIIGVIILSILFFNINLVDLSQRIATASPSFVLMSFMFILFFTTLKAVRWRMLVGKGRLINFFSIVQIGSLLTNILPAQLQEPIRAVLLKEKEKIEIGHGLSSIFVERLMDIIGLLVIGIIASILFPTTDAVQSWIFVIIRNIIIFTSILTGFFIILVLKPTLFSRIFHPFKKNQRLAKLYDKFEFLLLDLSKGVKKISKKPTNLIGSFLLTIFMWMINFLAVYLLFISVNFQIDPILILFGFVGTALGMSLPQSPGYVGTFEAIWLGAFSTLGYEKNDEILAVGILYHLLVIIHNFVLGIIGMFILKLSIKELFNFKKKS